MRSASLEMMTMNKKLRKKLHEALVSVREITEDCAESKKELRQCITIIEDAEQKLCSMRYNPNRK